MYYSIKLNISYLHFNQSIIYGRFWPASCGLEATGWFMHTFVKCWLERCTAYIFECVKRKRIYTDHFNGPGEEIDSVCVCVYVRATTSELNDL